MAASLHRCRLSCFGYDLTSVFALFSDQADETNLLYSEMKLLEHAVMFVPCMWLNNAALKAIMAELGMRNMKLSQVFSEHILDIWSTLTTLTNYMCPLQGVLFISLV